MILSRLYIQNFRCFGAIPAIINFSETGLSAFVGSNNAGKSTALKAVEILLGDKWPVSQFSEDDFYMKDHSRTIKLACEFDESLYVPAKKGSTELKKIEGAVIEVKYLESGFGESATEVTWHLLSDITNFNNGDWEIACYGTSAIPMYISQEIRNSLPIAIIIPLIKLSSEQPTNKWSILGRMMQKVENTFNSDTDKKVRFGKKIVEAVDVLREPTEFISLEGDIKDFWNQICPINLSGTTLEFLDHDPWHYYRQFRLAITKNGEDVPLESLGEGVQRLAVIALYRAYLKGHSRNQKAILLIEEPESYLHPQARNVVYRTLRKAIEGTDIEGQIIYTTHSSDFIDCASFEEIALFSETTEGSTVRQVTYNQMKAQTSALIGIDPSKQVSPSIYYRLIEADSVGLKDALFASRAVVVEGSTDYEFLKFLDYTDWSQMSIVKAGGKDNIQAIFTFLTAFGVPVFICADRDTKSAKLTNAQLVSLINEPSINQLAPGVIPVDPALIDSIPDGERASYRNLLIFAKDLEDFLKNTIPEYEILTSSLKETLNLGASKPKLMFAIGQCKREEIPGITLTEIQVSALDNISKDIRDFLKQDLPQPILFNKD